MNRERRKRLQTVALQLSDVLYETEKAREEEVEALENIPENLEYSDRYLNMEEVSYRLESASELVSLAIENIEQAINY